MNKVRYAVVGNGWISQEAFIPGLRQTGNSEITAIVSGNAERARKIADFHGIPHVFSYGEYDKMLAQGIVDAVYVALPNSQHADFALRAARAGKHALVEKPLATTLEETHAMIDTAAKHGVFLSTAYRLHTDRATLDVYDLIRSGAIGDPRHYHSSFSFQIGPSNHRLLAEHWGGALGDIGVYCINAARHSLSGEPTEVMAMDNMGWSDTRFKQVPASVSAMMRFPEGRIATFTCSFGADPTDTFTVLGSEGRVSIDNAFNFGAAPIVEHVRAGKTVRTAYPLTDNFSGQTAYFSDCILKGEKPEPDGEDGLADMMIMLAIEESVRTGKSQALNIPPRKSYAQMSQLRSFPTVSHRLLDL